MFSIYLWDLHNKKKKNFKSFKPKNFLNNKILKNLKQIICFECGSSNKKKISKIFPRTPLHLKAKFFSVTLEFNDIHT